MYRMTMAIALGTALCLLLRAGWKIALEPPPPPKEWVRVARSEAPAPVDKGEVTVRRDLFHARRAPAIGTSELPYQAIATMVVPSDERWSLAVIRGKGGRPPEPALYRRGMLLPDGQTRVLRIVDRKVYVGRAGKISLLQLDDADSPPTVPRTIARAEIDRVMDDLPQLAKDARIVPAFHRNGFRIYAIRPGSRFAELGLENGDLILAVNGMQGGSPDDWLAIYNAVRRATFVSVDVERRGAPFRLEYSITR
jgi:general secretion pathway protein C